MQRSSQGDSPQLGALHARDDDSRLHTNDRTLPENPLTICRGSELFLVLRNDLVANELALMTFLFLPSLETTSKTKQSGVVSLIIELYSLHRQFEAVLSSEQRAHNI